MGMTLLCVKEDGLDTMRFFVSNEYPVHKERDAEGKVLPDQEWQHPNPRTLRYTRFGEWSCPESFVRFLEAWLDLGVREFGGQVRLIQDGGAEIANGREVAWDEKLVADELRREELEAERERERWIEEQKRAPFYDWCARCGAEREACKNPAHGGNKCMHCSGGVGDTDNRYCTNCLDQPYRKMREKAVGHPIVYSGESERDD